MGAAVRDGYRRGGCAEPNCSFAVQAASAALATVLSSVKVCHISRAATGTTGCGSVTERTGGHEQGELRCCQSLAAAAD